MKYNGFLSSFWDYGIQKFQRIIFDLFPSFFPLHLLNSGIFG